MGPKLRTGNLFLLPMMILALFCSIGVNRLNAQGSSATVLGTVSDSSGAAIPDAMVQVKNVATGVMQTIPSDAQGRYRVPEITIGDYELQASKVGFATVVHKGVTLTVGSQTVVDFALPVGQQQQTVTVEGEAAAVETTNAAVGTSTSQEQMRELPLNGRNFEQLIQLAPGVSTVQFANNAMQGRAAQYSVAGGRPEGQAIMMDDENLQSFWNNGISSITGSSIGIEAIAEFQTLTNAYGAQFGGNGAVINAASKSGTNSFHGSAFDFLRNSVFDARDFFLRTRHDPPPFRRNQFGGSVGGPIQKDKFFFFVDYEGIRQYLQQNVGLANVPDCSGGFTTGLCAITATNPITAAAIKNTLLLYPSPDNPTGVGNVVKQATTFGNNVIHENYVLFRLDYTFGPKDSIFARYYNDKADQLSPFAGAGISVGGGPLPYWPGTDNSQSQYTTIEERHIFSSSIVNLFKVSYSRPTKSSAELDKATAPDGSHPLQFFPQATNLEDGFINDTAAGLTPLGPATGTGHFTLAQNRYAIGDDVLWTKGAHSLRFGFTGDRLLNNSWNPISEDVVWTFTSFANFLAGNSSLESGVIPAPGNTAHRDYFQYHYAPYVQDDWKISPKLTVNLGVRYELASNVTERHDLLYTVLDYVHDTNFTRVPHVFQNNPSFHNIDPRVGLAYDPFADHKTAIRAGFGMFHDPISVQAYQTGFGGAYPWQQAALPVTVNGVTTPAIYPFPPTSIPQLSQTLPWYYPISTTPYMIQYNLNVQRELIANTVLTVGYVGSKGTHLLTGIEANPPVPTIDANGVYHFTNAAGVQNPRVNPNILYFVTNRPISDSRYNSLQTSLNRRFSRSVQAQFSYTYSKCMDDGAFGVGSFNGSSTTSTPSALENPFNQKIDRAVCGYDITNVFRLNGLWALPFHGNRFIEGWQLSGVLSKYGGVPINANTGFDRAGFTSGNTPRPDYVAGCDPYAGAQTVAHWYNTSCYSLEPVGTFGDTGRNTLRGPGFFNTDLSLSKETVIREQIKLQFRYEVFNIFNHENLGNPANNIFSASGAVNSAAGVITNSNPGSTPRQMQFGLKLTF